MPRRSLAATRKKDTFVSQLRLERERWQKGQCAGFTLNDHQASELAEIIASVERSEEKEATCLVISKKGELERMEKGGGSSADNRGRNDNSLEGGLSLLLRKRLSDRRQHR